MNNTHEWRFKNTNKRGKRAAAQKSIVPPSSTTKMNSNSSKVSPRTRKRKQKDEMKEQIVAQVHKPVISTTSSENDYEDNVESNRTYTKYEDKNENISMHTPSREISVDGESQINSKIMTLIESEMRRDINKISHFTDSRPQSLSFYEDEKMPEELSGTVLVVSLMIFVFYQFVYFTKFSPTKKSMSEQHQPTSLRDAYTPSFYIYSPFI